MKIQYLMIKETFVVRLSGFLFKLNTLKNQPYAKVVTADDFRVVMFVRALW